MSKNNRLNEYKRLVALGREVPEVLEKEFGKVPTPVVKEEPKPVVKEEPKPVIKPKK